MYDLLGMAATNLYRIDGSSRKDALETFHRNVSNIMIQQTEHRAERSCSLRPRKAVAFLTHLRPAPKSKGAGSFAVCGQRLRGRVPSKNTPPAALSWSSLFGDSFSESFRFRTILCVVCFCRDTACRVRQFQQRDVRWKRSTGTFPKSKNSKRDTGRSGLVRSALEKLFPHFCFGKTNRTRHAVSLQVCILPFDRNDGAFLTPTFPPPLQFFRSERWRTPTSRRRHRRMPVR